MKATRKQKLRKKAEKQRNADDRKFAVLERMLNFYGLRGLFSPLEWMTKAEVAVGINPGLEVQIALDSQNDPELQEIKAICQKVVETPLPFTFDGQIVELSLDDICRAIHTVPELVRFLDDSVTNRRFPASAASASLREARKRVAQFDRARFYRVFGKLVRQLNSITDQYLHIGEKVIWHRMERSDRYPDRDAFRVLIGLKRPLPVSLPVQEGRGEEHSRASEPYRSAGNRATSTGTPLGLESAPRTAIYRSMSASTRSAGCTSDWRSFRTSRFYTS